VKSDRKYILNGNFVITKTDTTIDFDGKHIEYIVNDTCETIKSRGNFTQGIQVQVCLFISHWF